MKSSSSGQFKRNPIELRWEEGSGVVEGGVKDCGAGSLGEGLVEALVEEEESSWNQHIL